MQSTQEIQPVFHTFFKLLGDLCPALPITLLLPTLGASNAPQNIKQPSEPLRTGLFTWIKACLPFQGPIHNLLWTRGHPRI